MTTINLSELTPAAQARARLIRNNGGQPAARPKGKGYQVEDAAGGLSGDWLRVIFPDTAEAQDVQAAAPKPEPPATYRQKLEQIAAALDALHEQAQAIRDQMAALEAQGIVDASPYWRKNRSGEKTILTFTHSTSSERVRSGKSRSQYIGDKNAKPEKVQAALDALERYKEHAKLKRDLADLEGRIAREQSTISTMLLRLKNEQTKLPI
jgi:hypothetical protein